MKPLLLMLVAMLSACATPSQRSAARFVESDAASDAYNSAADSCNGKIELIPGTKAYGMEDYRCIPNDPSISR